MLDSLIIIHVGKNSYYFLNIDVYIYTVYCIYTIFYIIYIYYIIYVYILFL